MCRVLRKAVGIFATGLELAASALGVVGDHQTPANFISSLHKQKATKRRPRQQSHTQRTRKQAEKQNPLHSLSEPENLIAKEWDVSAKDNGDCVHHADHASDDEDPLENFGEVISALDPGKLQQAALLVRLYQTVPEQCSVLKLEEAMSLSCEIHPVPESGSYNLAYLITFPDGVKWVARVPGHGFGARWGELDASKMDSEYRTLQLIKKNTSIPVPEVLHYDTSCAYAGAPYALISCVEGTPLADLWMHDLPETNRLKVLSEIAGYMSQLHSISFDRLGMPEYAPSGALKGIGKCITLMEFISWHTTCSDGPYNTFLESLWDAFDEHEDMHVNQRSNIPILRMAIQSMPDYLTQDRKFCLNYSDFNYQNLLLDDECNITGFIDWDCTQSEAAAAGYARYPSWITRDWDPIMYSYDEEAPLDGPSANESSPETLSRYRHHYAREFIKHAAGFVDYDLRMTILSHLVEAIVLAVLSPINRSEIVEKLLDHAFDGSVPFRWFEYVRDYREGRRSKKDELIKKAFAKMWHAEWEKPSAQACEENDDVEAGVSVTSKVHVIEVKVDKFEIGEDVVESENAPLQGEKEGQGPDDVQQSGATDSGAPQQHLQMKIENQESHQGQGTQVEERNTQVDGHNTQVDGNYTQVEGHDMQEDGHTSRDEGDEHQQQDREEEQQVDPHEESNAKGLSQAFKHPEHRKLLSSFSKSHTVNEKTTMRSNIKKQARRIIGVFKKKQYAASGSEKS